MSVHLYAYRNVSMSARALAESLGTRLIAHRNSRFEPSRDKVVINWGANEMPNLRPCKVINRADDVARSANKLSFFQMLRNSPIGINIPQFTDSIFEARRWANEEGGMVVCRTILNSHSGRGILLANTSAQVIAAPLYTKYIKKRDEYRVHMVRQMEDGIDGEPKYLVSKKLRDRDVPDERVNWQIRNHNNGFIYGLEENPDERLISMALSTLQILQLDFGAVDIIYNAGQDSFYVLEVNCAPGIVGRTLEFYFDAFKEYMD